MMNREDGLLPATKVLIVDDESGIRMILGRLLRSLNLDVYFAANGLEGLEQARRVLPDLVLLDMNMPMMGGLSMCHALKSSAETARIPVVFISGEGKLGPVEDAMSEGAAGYILKPFDLGRVSAKILEVLGKRAA